jgi:hypothetical protein
VEHSSKSSSESKPYEKKRGGDDHKPSEKPKAGAKWDDRFVQELESGVTAWEKDWQ